MGKISSYLYKIFLAAIMLPLLFESVFAQQGRNFILLEKNVLPSGNNYKCYVSYRINYDKLIFVQKDGGYSAGCNLEIELTEDSKILSRKSDAKFVSVKDYQSTLSEDNFVSGVIEFDLGRLNYVIRPFLSIDNSSIEIPLDTLTVNGAKNNLLKPIVLYPGKAKCAGEEQFVLENLANNIPFSDENAGLLVPVNSSADDQVKIAFEQNSRKIAELKPEKIFSGNPSIRECEGNLVVLRGDEKDSVEYLYVGTFSYLLDEGSVKISVVSGTDTLESYTMQVVWESKPASLFNPEYAVKKISLLDDKSAVDSILAKHEEEYYNLLKEYWDKLIPGRKSKYNQLMAEFYNRVDFCNKNYSTLNKQNGADSDRGKIYIKFGKPDEVKRSYSKNNAVMEVWIYANLNREFVFRDDSGLGNYTLVQ